MILSNKFNKKKLSAVLTGIICLGTASIAYSDYVIETKHFKRIPVKGAFETSTETVDTNARFNQKNQLEINSIEGRRYQVQLKHIRTISGNNPFNPRQPLRNFNGTEVSSNSALLSLINNGTSSNGSSSSGGSGSSSGGNSSGGGSSSGGSSSNTLSSCIRNVSMDTILPPPNPIYGANFEIDPITLNCVTAPPGLSGQGNFSITEAIGDASNTAIYIGSSGAASGDWTLDGGGTFQQYTVNVPVTVIARSNTGRRVQLVFQVTQGTPSSLQIISLTEL